MAEQGLYPCSQCSKVRVGALSLTNEGCVIQDFKPREYGKTARNAMYAPESETAFAPGVPHLANFSLAILAALWRDSLQVIRISIENSISAPCARLSARVPINKIGVAKRVVLPIAPSAASSVQIAPDCVTLGSQERALVEL